MERNSKNTNIVERNEHMDEFNKEYDLTVLHGGR
jgi:hypothetical protein